jgi:hypothetical protein
MIRDAGNARVTTVTCKVMTRLLRFNMYRRIRSVRFLLTVVMACSGFATAQSLPPNRHLPHGPVNESPTGFHVLLRKPRDRTAYKLGEKVELEVACISDIVGQYSSECHAELDLASVDVGAMLTVDAIQTDWVGGVLCPGRTMGTCGSFILPPDRPVGNDISWTPVWPKKHFPVTAGKFSVTASVSGFDRATDQVIRATSPPVDVEVVDEQLWREQTFERAVNASAEGYDLISLFPDVEAMRWLLSNQGFMAYGYPAAEDSKVNLIEVFPDRAAMASLLSDQLQNEMNGEAISLEIDEVLAMRLAAEEPTLYEKVTVNNNLLPSYSLSPDEFEQLRRWLLPRRRALLLEVGKSMKNDYAYQKELDPTDPYMDDLESKAEALVNLSISHCPDQKQSALKGRELEHFMLQAGLNSKFIAKELARIPAQQK